MRARRLANWGPTHETPAGRPHLKPQVGGHLEQRLAAPPPGPKRRTRGQHDSVPKRPHRPRDSSPKRLDQLAALSRAQSRLIGRLRNSSPKWLDWMINGLAACQGPHLQRLPNTCAQSPAGPTGSLGQRQNTQQRGAAGLGETAFPRKTQLSRGLNYPIAALRAPSI